MKIVKSLLLGSAASLAAVAGAQAADLPVTGELPRDLDGVFLRNGPNPVYAPRGRYHWFDGDGMVHAVSFRDGRASYRNRWVRTQGLAAEREAGRALWPGYLERPDPESPGSVRCTTNACAGSTRRSVT